jgi:hypothetical protein
MAEREDSPEIVTESKGEMHMWRTYTTRLIDPRWPIGRLAFGITQFVAISLAQALLGPIDSIVLKNCSAVSMSLVFGSTSAALCLMGIATVKRLLDVGWPRYWAILISGPMLMHLLLAVGRSNPQFLRATVVPAGLLSMAYFGLMIILLVTPMRVDRDSQNNLSADGTGSFRSGQ